MYDFDVLYTWFVACNDFQVAYGEPSAGNSESQSDEPQVLTIWESCSNARWQIHKVSTRVQIVLERERLNVNASVLITACFVANY